MSQRALTNIVFVLTLAISGQADASAASRLVYTRTTGAAHCPDEKRFRTAVAERLGYDPFFPWAEQTVTVDIFEEKGSLRAKLTLVDRDGIVRGTRTLRGRARDCEELLASLALATSITLDPMAAQIGGAPPAEHSESWTEVQRAPPLATEATSPTPDPSGTPSSVRERAAQRHGEALFEVRTDAPAPVQWSVSAGPVVAIGATPGVSMGGRLGTELQRGHFALGVELRGALPTRQDSDAGGAVHVGVLGGALAPCFKQGPLSACGIVYLGSMQTRGSEVEMPVSTSLWFAAAGARAWPTRHRIECGPPSCVVPSRLALRPWRLWPSRHLRQTVCQWRSTKATSIGSRKEKLNSRTTDSFRTRLFTAMPNRSHRSRLHRSRRSSKVREVEVARALHEGT
jgi:hypothetical protein